jgi:hypothetical protein
MEKSAVNTVFTACYETRLRYRIHYGVEPEIRESFRLGLIGERIVADGLDGERARRQVRIPMMVMGDSDRIVMVVSDTE